MIRRTTELIDVELRFLLLGVGHGRAERLQEVARRGLLRVAQDRHRVVDRLAANEVGDEPHFLRGALHVPEPALSLSSSLSLRRGRSGARSRLRGRARRSRNGGADLGLLAAVALEDPRHRELAELVADHVLR